MSRIHTIVEAQRAYFSTGAALPVEFRLHALKKLRTALNAHEADIAAVKDQFLEYLKSEIHRQYDYACTGRIVSRRHFERLLCLMDPAKVIIGGQGDPETLKIQPTVMENVTWEDAVMQEEIFGPILPVLTFETIEEVIETVNSREKPLASVCLCARQVRDPGRHLPVHLRRRMR